MINLYKYLYYRLYSWNLRVRGAKDAPQWNAVYAVSFFMFFNLFFLCSVILYLFFDTNVYVIDFPLVEILSVFAALLVINYFRFIYKGKYKTIGEKYQYETRKQRLIRAFLLWLFCIMSFAIVSCLYPLLLRYLEIGYL